eukprot:1157677-Pelagomonas_calceolata.AAC.7
MRPRASARMTQQYPVFCHPSLLALAPFHCAEEEDAPKEPPADEFDEILRREHELDERQMERDW